MKKNLIYLVMAILMALPSAAYAGKLDLQLKMLAQRPDTGKAMLGKSVSVKGGREVVDVIIKSSDTALTKNSIEENGGTVRSVIGKIMTAFVPVSYLDALENLDEVEAVEASVPMKNLLDSARSNTGVATLQAGYQDVRYTGKNVVVGVIDTGIDYSRSDFNNSDGKSRVQYLRFQSVAEDGFSITECANDAIRDGSCEISADNDKTAGHGTHVTGIAAGSDSFYTGVAKAADIMLVRNDYYDDIDEDESSSFTAGVLDGVAEIFKKADILDKPAVINISQGTHIGAHDDTSLLEQGINDAVAGKYASNGKNYGRAVVVAAGNEYVNTDILRELGTLGDTYADHAGGIHASFDVPNGESHAWRLWVILGQAVGRIPLIIDAWFGVGSQDHCSVASNIYRYNDVASSGASTSKAVASVGDIRLSENKKERGESQNKIVATVVATDGADARNRKPRAIVSLGPGSSATTLAEAQEIMEDRIGIEGDGYVLDIIIRANGGKCMGDMWLEGGGTYANFMKRINTGDFDMTDGNNGAAYVFHSQTGSGNNLRTVGLPATASGVIAVGAYLQEKPHGQNKSEWKDYYGKTWDATDINSDPDDEAQINGGTIMGRCPFSSIGPTATGAVKPEIMAPGDPVISTLARGYDTFYETEYDMSFIPLKIDGAHFKSQGTSQASPHIAGLVALLFQKNDTLTADQTKDAIIAGGSLTTPTYEVGYGNVSATKVIDSVSSPDTRGYNGTGDLKTSDLNPSSSKGCGGSIAPFDSAGSVSQIIMLALAAAGIAARRMKRF
ncbi:MAG TPA: S8 family serine peptidase [bacterium]|mgnify:CR=1 FL=1|nr:S8 family serine peptidase [bacterium]HQH80126.1 S8 family serine peptidase [bacterium]